MPTPPTLVSKVTYLSSFDHSRQLLRAESHRCACGRYNDVEPQNRTGHNEHSVTADDGCFDSGDLNDSHQSFSQTFNTAGTFLYHCRYHGGAGGVGMSGKVVVMAANASGGTTSPGGMPQTGGGATSTVMLFVVPCALALLAAGAVLNAYLRRRA